MADVINALSGKVEDGVYLQLVCYRNNIAYPSKMMKLEDFVKYLTDGTMDGLEKASRDMTEIVTPE